MSVRKFYTDQEIFITGGSGKFGVETNKCCEDITNTVHICRFHWQECHRENPAKPSELW